MRNGAILALLSFVLATALHAQVIGTVNFDFDSAELDVTATAKIDEIAEQLKTTQSYKPTVVIGHTDAVGSSGYNLSLGQRRANAVANALIARGVSVDRIGPIESRGKSELLVAVGTPERRNRRVSVTLDQMMAACRNFRDVALTRQSIGSELQTDLKTRLSTAMVYYQEFESSGRNTPAFQVAGAARETCDIAVGYDAGALRKLEYAKRCFCNSARLDVALGKTAP